MGDATTSSVDVRFHHPFSMMIVGPSGCGKTQFTLNFLRNIESLVKCDHPMKVIWCYSIWQPCYENNGFSMIKGLPDDDQLEAISKSVLVIDDMMDEADEFVSKMFTKYCHHRSISCIFITQNLFSRSKFSRNISLNANYIVIMKSNRDKAQICCLARQIFPNFPRFLISSYEDATRMPFSYLLIDFTPTIAADIRVRAQIFPADTMIVYLPTYK